MAYSTLQHNCHWCRLLCIWGIKKNYGCLLGSTYSIKSWGSFCRLFHKPFLVSPAVAPLLGRQGILQTSSIVCFTNSGRSLWKTWIESLLQCKQMRAASSLHSQIWPNTVDIQEEQVRDQCGSFKDGESIIITTAHS